MIAEQCDVKDYFAVGEMKWESFEKENEGLRLGIADCGEVGVLTF